MSRNDLLRKIVLSKGGTITNPNSRNGLLQDWLDAVTGGQAQFAPNQTFTLIPLDNGDVDSAFPAGQPGIDSVSGTIADGQVLTISGSAFGGSPENVMFENYENGTEGSQILATNTNFDVEPTSLAKAVRDSDSRSGTFSASQYQTNGTNWVLAALGLDLGGVTEVFASYAIKVPSGSNFPGNDGGNSGTNADYSTDSSWKPAWLLGDNASSANDDVVIPSHIGSGIWSHAGNDLGQLKNWGTDPTWWAWTKWNRMTTWAKAGASPAVDSGNLYFQVANTTAPIFEDSTTPVIFANGTPPNGWHQLNIGGWARERADQGNVKILCDDVYVAWGANASSRVELGNASTYAACTDLAVCDPTTWVDGQITVNCREGGLDLSQPTWLFVTVNGNTTTYSEQVVF